MSYYIKKAYYTLQIKNSAKGEISLPFKCWEKHC